MKILRNTFLVITALILLSVATYFFVRETSHFFARKDLDTICEITKNFDWGPYNTSENQVRAHIKYSEEIKNSLWSKEIKNSLNSFRHMPPSETYKWFKVVATEVGYENYECQALRDLYNSFYNRTKP